MVDEGCMKGVDEVYGYHNWPAFRYGVMHICKGPIMGHPSGFEIIITGKYSFFGVFSFTTQTPISPICRTPHFSPHLSI